MENLFIALFDWLQSIGVKHLENWWIRATIILVLTWLAAYIAEKSLQKAYELRGNKTPSQLDKKIISILKRPLFWTIFLLGCNLAIKVIVSEDLAVITSASFRSIIVIIITLTAYRIARLSLQEMSRSHKKTALVKRETLPLFQNLALLLIFVVGTYLLFSTWKVDMTAWFASAGIAGVAIGFAAKDTLANLISGVFILADSPYRIGDTIVLESGERGEVTHIGLRSTRIYTTDHAEISIPNALMGNSRVTNQSGGSHRKARIRAPIGVAYGCDVDQVRGILEDIANSHESICDDPAPRVRFRQFGTSSLDFELLFWIENAIEKGRVLDQVNTTIYKQFNAKGIEVPYTKQELYIKELPKK